MMTCLSGVSELVAPFQWDFSDPLERSPTKCLYQEKHEQSARDEIKVICCGYGIYRKKRFASQTTRWLIGWRELEANGRGSTRPSQRTITEINQTKFPAQRLSCVGGWIESWASDFK